MVLELCFIRLQIACALGLGFLYAEALIYDSGGNKHQCCPLDVIFEYQPSFAKLIIVNAG